MLILQHTDTSTHSDSPRAKIEGGQGERGGREREREEGERERGSRRGWSEGVDVDTMGKHKGFHIFPD